LTYKLALIANLTMFGTNAAFFVWNLVIGNGLWFLWSLGAMLFIAGCTAVLVWNHRLHLAEMDYWRRLRMRDWN
jgi:hypothetical protein